MILRASCTALAKVFTSPGLTGELIGTAAHPGLTSVRAAIILFVEERVLAIVDPAHQAPFALLVAVAVTFTKFTGISSSAVCAPLVGSFERLAWFTWTFCRP